MPGRFHRACRRFETRFGGHWLYQILLVLAGTFFYLCLDYSFYMLQVWHFYWPFGLWTIIALGSALNARK